MTTTMNTGAASLSDERINELALLNLEYDRTVRPIDFARAIEREVLACAAIAAGGAQEPDVLTIQTVKTLLIRHAESYSEWDDGSIERIDFGQYGFGKFARALLAASNGEQA
ncbi:hypothetical protein [Paraburkholderia caledonica]|uniref:hypothetical protein n=1 Tax=Paraburkholderia caledonica TaxID=134536 RepID=UPI0038BCBE5E